MRRFAVVAAAAVAAVAGASAAAYIHERPPTSSREFSGFVIMSTFWGLQPDERYAVSWTAHFADGDRYWLGGTWGVPSSATGLIRVWTDVEDLTYYDAGNPLDWVRVCLRPPGTPVDFEMIGADGLPVCANVDTEGFVYVGEEYPQPYVHANAALLAGDVVQTDDAGKAKQKRAKRVR
jgi:hypothetical protein